MQTQDAPAEFLFKLWPWLEANKNRLLGAVAAVVVAVGIYYFISAREEQKEIDAGQALTQLLVTPPSAANPTQMADSLVQLAGNFSGTAAAQRAQLQAAASYFNLGRYTDAQAQFQKFLDSYSTGAMVASASLGLATSLEAQGKLDEASAAYQKVTSNYPGTASALTAECALGRLAETQGKLAEAQSHYEAAMHFGSIGGSLVQEAEIHYSSIKARLDQAHKSTAPILSK